MAFSRCLAALLLLATAGCERELPSSVQARAQAIVAGAPTQGHAPVAALRVHSYACGSTEPVRPFCSAVLVAPRVALTSAHCVLDAPVDQLELFFGEDIAAPGEVRDVQEIAIH